MSSVAAQRKGRNLVDFQHSHLGFHGSGKRLTNRNNSYQVNANYGGRKSIKSTTLTRALANAGQSNENGKLPQQQGNKNGETPPQRQQQQQRQQQPPRQRQEQQQQHQQPQQYQQQQQQQPQQQSSKGNTWKRAAGKAAGADVADSDSGSPTASAAVGNSTRVSFSCDVDQDGPNQAYGGDSFQTNGNTAGMWSELEPDDGEPSQSYVHEDQPREHQREVHDDPKGGGTMYPHTASRQSPLPQRGHAVSAGTKGPRALWRQETAPGMGRGGGDGGGSGGGNRTKFDSGGSSTPQRPGIKKMWSAGSLSARGPTTLQHQNTGTTAASTGNLTARSRMELSGLGGSTPGSVLNTPRMSETSHDKFSLAPPSTFQSDNAAPHLSFHAAAMVMGAVKKMKKDHPLTPSSAPTRQEPLNRLSAFGQRGTMIHRGTVDLLGPDGWKPSPKYKPPDYEKRFGPDAFILPDRNVNHGKDRFDEEVADALLGSTGRCRSLSPSRSREAAWTPMAVAFTDRSLRLREGAGCNAAMDMSHIPDTKGDDAMDIYRSQHFEMQPSGVLSDRVPGNLLHPVYHGPDAGMPVGTSRPPHTRRAMGSPTNMSRPVAKSISEEPDPEGEHCEEVWFQQKIGRKLKADSAAQDGQQHADSAGRFALKYIVDLETPQEQRKRIKSPSARLSGRPRDWAGLPNSARNHPDPEGRGQVAMMVSPRRSDPEPPLRITSERKGAGVHKNYHSEQCEKIWVNQHPEFYRYELAAVRGGLPRRGVSLPPERQRRVRGDRNPVAHLNEDEVTPVRAPRTNASNLSPGFEATNDARVAAEAAQARAYRLVEDSKFANLCTLTSQNKSLEVAEMAERTLNSSANMASALTWND